MIQEGMNQFEGMITSFKFCPHIGFMPFLMGLTSSLLLSELNTLSLVNKVNSKFSLSSAANQISSANWDWPNLGFEYRQTNSFVKCTAKNGVWGPIEVVKGEPYVKIHIGATALHYGQACFEGLKAFQCADGKVKIFRPQENAARLMSSCLRTCMTPLPESKFLEACYAAISDNLAYVPPYGSGGALYIRPILYGSGPRIGLQPADEYTLIGKLIT